MDYHTQDEERDDSYSDRSEDQSEDRNAPDQQPRIAALGDLGDFQIADGYPDPRGWDVVGANGLTVGKVHDLIVDTGEMRTRYLDVSLDKDAVGADDDYDVLVPIGAAKVDDIQDVVTLASLSTAQLASLPHFEHGEISRDYETSLMQRIDAGSTAASTQGSDSSSSEAGNYYATPHFDDQAFFGNRRTESRAMATDDESSEAGDADETRLTRAEEELEIGKRRVQAGEVNVHKHVETEHVTRPVTTRREEVTIERRPISADRASGHGSTATEIGDDSEIRIPITEEELVVEKRAVVKEELVIKKHMVTEDETVEADLRKERIDIDRSQERNASQAIDERDATQ